MASHSAKSLFILNIQSAQDCLSLYDGLSALRTSMELSWLLRASVVFVVSAIDTYFHDKVRYRVGKFGLDDIPPQLGNFEIQIKKLINWKVAARKGNVLRNWVTEYLSTKPLQSPNTIADALKLCGIESLWDKIEPIKSNKEMLLTKLNALVKRRNQIAHEGDRAQSRRSGKNLRNISRNEIVDWITFSTTLVEKIELSFPN